MQNFASYKKMHNYCFPPKISREILFSFVQPVSGYYDLAVMMTLHSFNPEFTLFLQIKCDSSFLKMRGNDHLLDNDV